MFGFCAIKIRACREIQNMIEGRLNSIEKFDIEKIEKFLDDFNLYLVRIRANIRYNRFNIEEENIEELRTRYMLESVSKKEPIINNKDVTDKIPVPRIINFPLDKIQKDLILLETNTDYIKDFLKILDSNFKYD